MARRPKIVACRQLGGIGDVLAMSCLYRGLREKYPDHVIHLICGRVYLAGAVYEIAKHNPFIDEIHPIEPYEYTDEATRRHWHQYFANTPPIENELIWQQADIALGLNTPCVAYEWEAMNSPEGIQKPRYQIWCDAAGVVPSTYAPIYIVTKEEQRVADEYIREHGWNGKKIVGVGVTACDNKRALGIGHLKEVCLKLQEAGIVAVSIDPAFKFDDSDGIPYIIGKRVSELMPIINRMAAMVSVDSGLLHMAGTMGTPVVGIFGPTDYRMRMGMYLGSAIDSTQLMECAPCWYKYPCLRNYNDTLHYQCLKKIKSDIIVEETLRWVNN